MTGIDERFPRRVTDRLTDGGIELATSHPKPDGLPPGRDRPKVRLDQIVPVLLVGFGRHDASATGETSPDPVTRRDRITFRNNPMTWAAETVERAIAGTDDRVDRTGFTLQPHQPSGLILGHAGSGTVHNTHDRGRGPGCTPLEVGNLRGRIAISMTDHRIDHVTGDIDCGRPGHSIEGSHDQRRHERGNRWIEIGWIGGFPADDSDVIEFPHAGIDQQLSQGWRLSVRLSDDAERMIELQIDRETTLLVKEPFDSHQQNPPAMSAEQEQRFLESRIVTGQPDKISDMLAVTVNRNPVQTDRLEESIASRVELFWRNLRAFDGNVETGHRNISQLDLHERSLPFASIGSGYHMVNRQSAQAATKGGDSMAEHATTVKLWEAIDARRDELIQIVADLVHFPSVLGLEAGVQGYIAEHLLASGFDTESWDLDETVKTQPNAGESNVPFPGRPNVTGKRAGTGGGRSLIMNGHVDVVSAEPVAAWHYDPWAAEIVGDRMYGRGAYDMKSGVALNLFLSRLLTDLNIQLKGDFTIHSVIEEECTGNGALAASLRDKADACVVTEPHFGDFTQAHLGVMWFRIKIEGKSAHAGHAWQGVNAIVKAAPIVLALRDLDEAMNVHVHPLWEGITHPINLNVGVISGGDWPSTVPGACEIHCRTSFFPNMSKDEIAAKIEETVMAVASVDPWLAEHSPTIIFDGFHTDGVILDPNEPFLQVLGDASRTVLGRPFEGRIATAVNDMRYYIFQGVPSTCFGAAGGNAHAADEWLDLTTMSPAAKVLAKFMVDWCGVA